MTLTWLLDAPPPVGSPQVRAVSETDIQLGIVVSAFFPANVSQLFRVWPPLTGRRGEYFFSRALLSPKVHLSLLLSHPSTCIEVDQREEWIKSTYAGFSLQSWKQVVVTTQDDFGKSKVWPT